MSGSSRLRIVSYNVHGCVGTDRVFSPERIAAVLEALQPDVIALQEVESRLFGGQAVEEYLAQRLHMHAYAGPTLRRSDADYGNLLLAKTAASSVRTHDISTPGVEPRGAIEARFNIGHDHVRVVATHLGLGVSERCQQVQQLLSDINFGDADVDVLAGDINEWRPFARPLRLLQAAFGYASGVRSFPANLPVFALDRIFVSPANAAGPVHADKSRASRVASDHLPLVCDIATEPQAV